MSVLTPILLVGLFQKTAAEQYPSVVVETVIDAPLDSVFNYIVPVKLETIFKRYKNLPAIVRTDESEKWITPGLTRTVYFEDGSTAKESLLTVVPSKSFSYQIEDFTSPLRFLAKRIEGSWKFIELPGGKVKIEWTYQVTPKHFMAKALVKVFLLRNVEGLLTNALKILKTDLEARRD